jgi:hypothetical protein
VKNWVESQVLEPLQVALLLVVEMLDKEPSFEHPP